VGIFAGVRHTQLVLCGSARASGRRDWHFDVAAFSGQPKSISSNALINVKMLVFYGVRVCLAAACARAEATFYASVVEHLNPRIGRYLLIMLLFSPAMYIASAGTFPIVIVTL
jgi:alpha-1,2-mannosyltransferase